MKSTKWCFTIKHASKTFKTFILNSFSYYQCTFQNSVAFDIEASNSIMGGTGLQFESFQVQNHIQNVSQHHFD